MYFLNLDIFAEEGYAAWEISNRPLNSANNDSFKYDIAEGPNSDPLFLPANVRSSEQPHDLGVTFAQDSRRINIDVVVNIEPNCNHDILTATKYVSPHNSVPSPKATMRSKYSLKRR